MQLKSDLRQIYLSIRQNILNRESKDNLICDKVFSMPQVLKAKRVLCYVSIGSEVNTIHLINKLLTKKITVDIPVFYQGIMFGKNVNTTNELKYFSPNSQELCSNVLSNYDCVITPLVAFDENKNRLGRGGGYYDKYFLNANKNMLKIGIAYEEQFSSQILAIETHDQKLDIIVTNRRIL